ncbi:hypothetical protein SAMN05444507_112142 [Pseudomonas syringae]|uniref:hypothetical protein n=1 Tax=Pseudomonas syringae TaxID=317 RepID=UPI0007EE2E02|nr:hypothetical protein [Pseudomonas syringae]OBS37851.1 hypothetical protein A9K79_20210 [Pseudomonas syringae pv. syringae]SFI90108.1 hypothetical protein SAMN05444507_112142 [Pseudomonas syringae]
MRRQAFIRSVERVVSDIIESGIDTMFDTVAEQNRKSPGDGEKSFSYSLFLNYSLRTVNYSKPEVQILDIMGLGQIRNPDWWQGLSKMDQPSVFQVRRALLFTVNFLPLLSLMLKRDYVDSTEEQSEHLASQGMALLSIVLIEDEGQRSTPDRLILALQAVTEMYQAIATLEGESHSDLSVVAIDSGSDKSFDFLGLAKVMAIVKDTLLAIWDRRVFHRHLHVSMCMQTISESLPIIERIHQLKENGALSPEQAELLKRQMVNGSSKLLEVGAVSPEMESQPGSSPRALMRPEPKLLAAPLDIARDSGNSADHHKPQEQNSGLSKDELELLEKLLEKSRRHDSSDSFE